MVEVPGHRQLDQGAAQQIDRHLNFVRVVAAPVAALQLENLSGCPERLGRELLLGLAGSFHAELAAQSPKLFPDLAPETAEDGAARCTKVDAETDVLREPHGIDRTDIIKKDPFSTFWHAPAESALDKFPQLVPEMIDLGARQIPACAQSQLGHAGDDVPAGAGSDVQDPIDQDQRHASSVQLRPLFNVSFVSARGEKVRRRRAGLDPGLGIARPRKAVGKIDLPPPTARAEEPQHCQ